VSDQWLEYDLAGLVATDESVVRRAQDGVLVSSTRPRWGYAALCDLSDCVGIEEVAVWVEVIAGHLSIALSSNDDAELLYEQPLPVGWRGSVYFPYAPAVGRTRLTLRSVSQTNAPLVALVRSVKLLTSLCLASGKVAGRPLLLSAEGERGDYGAK